MRPHLVPSNAELHRQHDREMREIGEQLDYLVDRARSLKKDIELDIPESRDSQARIAAAITSMTGATWFLHGARRALP